MAQASRSFDDVNPLCTLRAQRKSEGGGISYWSRHKSWITAPFSPLSIQVTQRRNKGLSNSSSSASAALKCEKARRNDADKSIRRIRYPFYQPWFLDGQSRLTGVAPTYLRRPPRCREARLKVQGNWAERSHVWQDRSIW